MASQHTEQKKVPIYFRVIGEGLLCAVNCRSTSHFECRLCGNFLAMKGKI